MILNKNPSDTPMVHDTSIVHPGAAIEPGVSIGPYCVVGPHAHLGEGTVLHSHVVVEGRTTLGAKCQVFPFASLGHAPQDRKYVGEPSAVIVGHNTIIREYVTIQPGTSGGIMKTTVGSDCLLMASTHVAHDCQVGDGVIMANNATLGGHVTVGDNVVLGGMCAVHQFVRIGEGAMVAGMTGISEDVIPYGRVGPEHNVLSGLNLVGLRRSGAPSADIQKLRAAHEHLFEGPQRRLEERLQDLPSELTSSPLVQAMVSFLNSNQKRPLCLPRDFNKL
jgi:UDP-N-acetylglucosamine acyltransferase